MPGGIHRSANQSVSSELRPNALARLEDLGIRRRQPYYGRVDYIQAGKLVTVYIGRDVLFEDQYGEHKVASRHSEAARIFTRERAGRHLFERAGEIDLLLQRNLKVDLGYVRHFNDNFDERHREIPGAEAVAPGTLSGRERHLIEVLYTRGDGNARLQDIVETIQEHQDDFIRAPADQCLVINGVAGSGKTSVAYHRIDYLVNAGRPPIRPDRTIIFGPNSVFLNHVRELLPGLGISGVTETTFDAWAFAELGYGADTTAGKKAYRLQDRALQTLLGNDSKAKNDEWRQGRIKGSLNFAKLIEAYAAYRRDVIAVPHQGWSYDAIGLPGVILTGTEIRAMHADTMRLDAAFEEQRLKILDQAQKAVRRKALLTMRPEAFAEVENKVNETVQDDLETACPAFDVHTDYYGLLTNPALLRKLGRGLFKADDLTLIAQRSFPRANSFDVQDIPALYYMHKLMTRTTFETFDHIVVDEAQDLSPFQFKLLQMHSTNDSMTVLGDIAQAVHGYRGLNDWKELTPVFTKRPKRVAMTKSFRSTSQIVAFGNEILKEVRGASTTVAEPIPRDGLPPVVYTASDEDAMYARVASDLRHLLSSEEAPSNIALITRTDQDARELERQLAKYDLKPDRVMTILGNKRNVDYRGGVVILPAALSKGIEFEAVFVVQVSDAAYNKKISYDGRLLYVAVTRALHRLNLYHTGELSGFVVAAAGSATLITAET